MSGMRTRRGALAEVAFLACLIAWLIVPASRTPLLLIPLTLVAAAGASRLSLRAMLIVGAVIGEIALRRSGGVRAAARTGAICGWAVISALLLWPVSFLLVAEGSGVPSWGAWIMSFVLALPTVLAALPRGRLYLVENLRADLRRVTAADRWRPRS